MGVPHEDICKLIIGTHGKPIDDKTLRKHFRRELDTAAIKANQAVAGALFRMATDPKGGMKAVTAQIFWLKTRARWKETNAFEADVTIHDPVRELSEDKRRAAIVEAAIATGQVARPGGNSS
jgi:hypothetical protein